MSEGCSVAIEKTDYEDYSTVFLRGPDRSPTESRRPDWDSDGRVTPLEAHFHVLATAFSADIPRSTSESLLLEWQPGELADLLTDVDRNENDYTALAFEMMRSNGIDPAGDPGMELYRRQQRVLNQWQELKQDRERLREEIVSFQVTLKREVLRRWPTAAAAYSRGFKAFLTEDLDAAQAFITAQPEYLELWQRQERYLDQVDRVLQLRRENNQVQKIAHLLRLGRLQADLERDGPADLLERYRKLRECESAPF